MAASMSQLSFVVFVFCGGFLMVPHGCHAADPVQCTLADIKNCTGQLLVNLAPVLSCPQTELACLENLGDCDSANTIKSVYGYLCNNDTGGMDLDAVNTCFAVSTTKYDTFIQAAGVCVVNSGWMDTLEGQARCSAAKTLSACVRTAAEKQCSGDQAATYYDKTVELLTAYGSCRAEETTMKPKGEAAMMMPNLGMMAVVLGLSLIKL